MLKYWSKSKANGQQDFHYLPREDVSLLEEIETSIYASLSGIETP